MAASDDEIDHFWQEAFGNTEQVPIDAFCSSWISLTPNAKRDQVLEVVEHVFPLTTVDNQRHVTKAALANFVKMFGPFVGSFDRARQNVFEEGGIIQCWWFGSIYSKHDCERSVRIKVPSALIRWSESRPGHLALMYSKLDNNSVLHRSLLILRNGEGYSYEGSNSVYESLPALILGCKAGAFKNSLCVSNLHEAIKKSRSLSGASIYLGMSAVAGLDITPRAAHEKSPRPQGRPNPAPASLAPQGSAYASISSLEHFPRRMDEAQVTRSHSLPPTEAYNCIIPSVDRAATVASVSPSHHQHTHSGHHHPAQPPASRPVSMAPTYNDMGANPYASLVSYNPAPAHRAAAPAPAPENNASVYSSIHSFHAPTNHS